MKVIVDIPNNYDISKIQNGSIASKQILNAVKKGIEISENATVGDMIMSLFPNTINIGVVVLDKNENVLLHDVNYNWWNTLYKEI